MDDWGERLVGGNVGGAWRVGETVRRSTGPWSAAVHALLEHLHPRLDGVPRFLGFDEHGREILDFLPGKVLDVDTEELTDEQLSSVARWTRRLHRATADFDHPGPWRSVAQAGASIVGHGDLAPYNMCFQGDALVGVFDWDMAGPTSVEGELGFVAWNCIPLFRPMPDRWCVARLRLLAASYGHVTPERVLSAVFERVQASIDGIERGAAAGDEGIRSLMATTGEPECTRRALEALAGRRHALASLLKTPVEERSVPGSRSRGR